MADDAPHSSTFIAKPRRCVVDVRRRRPRRCSPAASPASSAGRRSVLRARQNPLPGAALSAQGAPLKHTSVLRSLIDMYRAGGSSACHRSAAQLRASTARSSALRKFQRRRSAFVAGWRRRHRVLRDVSARLYPRAATTDSGILASARVADVVRNEGFGALYRGLLPSIIGIVPYAGRRLRGKTTRCRRSPLKAAGNLNVSNAAAGAFAGMVGQTAAYPLDTVRRILQVQDIKVIRRRTTA